MKSNFEAVKYVPAAQIRTAIGKYNFVIEEAAKQIVDSAGPTDIISVRLTINSPLKIVKAANITKNPEDIFAVAED